ncbi:hypothetical protein BDF14DRAFT_1272458 [Spinellus fusiger]|nr:hypothetical protein BDF14DRAFT_1272458 [Spinellus fusiger]
MLVRVSSYLSRTALEKLEDALQFEASCFIDRLIKDGSTGEGLCPSKDIALMSLNTVLKVCFGNRISSKDDPLFMDIINIINQSMLFGGLGENIDTFIPALRFITYFKGNDKKGRYLMENVRNPLYRELIKQALERDEDCLAKIVKNSEKKDRYNDDDIIMIISKL